MHSEVYVCIEGNLRALRSNLPAAQNHQFGVHITFDRMITFVYGILAGIGSAISFGSFGECCSRAPQVADDFLAPDELSSK